MDSLDALSLEMPWTRLALTVSALLALLAGISYLVIRQSSREVMAFSRLPVDCARAYARVPTPADSNLADAVIPGGAGRQRDRHYNCGYYRGLARLQAARAADGHPAPARDTGSRIEPTPAH